MKNILIFSLHLLFFIFYFLYSASAQTISDFDIQLSNRFPFPNEQITASIVNANFDVLKSDMKWIFNNKIILQGKARDGIVFSVGKLGSSNFLTVSITTSGGEQLQKSITLRPADIDILWQADTYTPYAYKAKQLISPLSNVLVAAIPNFVFQNKKTEPVNLLFEWYLNNEIKIVGWGRDSFTFKTGLFKDENYDIKVRISNANKTLIQEKIIRLAARNPQINFYEYDPLEGIKLQLAVSDFNTQAGGYVQFIAEPYFVPNNQLNNLVYEWLMNGQKINAEPPFNIVNFSSEPGATENVFINLTISFKNLLEKVSNSFNIAIK